jgi:hypothetical protein
MRVLLSSSVLSSIVLVVWSSAALAAEEPPAPTKAPAVAVDTLPKAVPVAKAVPVTTKNQPTLADPLPTAKAKPMARTLTTPPAVAPLAVTVQLNIGNAELRGSLLSAPEISMKTSFGELNVPLSEVAGIKLASQGNTSTTIVMHNGDSITGAWDVNYIELRTEWGKATIDGTAINSILFAQGMAWVSEGGLSGKRWELMAKPQTEDGKTNDEPSQTADSLKQGDIIVVARDSDLQAGTDVVGKVSKDEVLAIEGVLDSWFYVDNGKAAGWISRENVAAYRDPKPGSPVAETAQTPGR